MFSATSNGQLTIPGAGPSLLELATELLLMVFELLDNEDLLRLSLSSARLHQVALEFYISRQHGSYSKSHVLLMGPPFPMLPALRMALFVQDLLHVSVMFTSSPIIPCMKGLERLIRRLSSVREFDIECSYLQILEPPGISEAIGGIFAALVGKACIALTIKGWHGGNINRLISGSSKSTKIISLPSSHDLPPLTTLNELRISRSIISPPRLRTWVINSINLSPITKLRLDGVTFSNSHSPMGEILRLLALPLLVHLHLSSDGLTFSDIVAFLCRHPRIENLSLATDVAIMSNSPFPAEYLPLLSTLKAPPHYVRHLFALSGSLPSLKFLVVDPSFPSMLYQHQSAIDQRFEEIEECFARLASRQGVTTLRLILPAESSAENWLRQGSHPKDGERWDVERSLAHVTTLEVDVTDCSSFSPAMEPLFLRWLALFPSLRHVNFDSFTFMRMSSDEYSAFADSVGKACSTVEIVEMRYKKYLITR